MDYNATAANLDAQAQQVLGSQDGSQSSVTIAQKLSVQISDFLQTFGDQLDASGGSMVNTLGQDVDNLVAYVNGNRGSLMSSPTMGGATAFGNSVSQDLSNFKQISGNLVNSAENALAGVGAAAQNVGQNIGKWGIGIVVALAILAFMLYEEKK